MAAGAPHQPAFQSSAVLYALLAMMLGLWLAASASIALATEALGIGAPRFGERDGQLRLVLDLPSEPRYSVDMADDRRAVLIEFSDGIGEPGRLSGPGQGAIDQYVWRRLPDGTWQMTLQAVRPMRVATVFTIPADTNNPPRFVLDLAPVHDAAPTEPAAPIVEASLPPVPQVKPFVAPPVPMPPRALPMVVLDPGHGGVDPGAVAANGLLEKNVVLEVSKLLAEKLRATGEYRVKLTRDQDEFIALRERVSRARQAGGTFFVSLHADANTDQSVRGASVYTLSERASDKEAARLAREENRSDAISGVDLNQQSDDVASILIDLAMRETVNDSRGIANIMVKEMRDRDIRVLRRTHRFAGFAVLKAADMPSVLIELGYMSNSKDVQLLQTRDYRDRITDALVAGIDRYFETLPQVAEN
ncbi:MAG: N-acetylmuramoyl-L-alanine amidase [Alphaproteobacteria bacterium]|nr:N-acetylmuramoyl-L-alanine amidase [Alphaproteobacteria bacterium SS10]